MPVQADLSIQVQFNFTSQFTETCKPISLALGYMWITSKISRFQASDGEKKKLILETNLNRSRIVTPTGREHTHSRWVWNAGAPSRASHVVACFCGIIFSAPHSAPCCQTAPEDTGWPGTLFCFWRCRRRDSRRQEPPWGASEGGAQGWSFVAPGCVQKVSQTTASENDSSN